VIEWKSQEVWSWKNCRIPGARFTEYLTTILQLFYDNAKVTVNLDGCLIYKICYGECVAFLSFDLLAKS